MLNKNNVSTGREAEENESNLERHARFTVEIPYKAMLFCSSDVSKGRTKNYINLF